MVIHSWIAKLDVSASKFLGIEGGIKKLTQGFAASSSLSPVCFGSTGGTKPMSHLQAGRQADQTSILID